MKLSGELLQSRMIERLLIIDDDVCDCNDDDDCDHDDDDDHDHNGDDDGDCEHNDGDDCDRNDDDDDVWSESWLNDRL